jgi:ParB family chromosome partitioning protein
LSVASIATNPLQPRKNFDRAELDELKASIASSGLLQPLLVRPRASGFELVAGERRFRAIQELGWREVPAHVRELDDQAVLTLALIENLQRTDLNPIEEAEGYQELVARFSLTQQQVADAVGRERSTVANMLRLLALPDSVRMMVRSGELSHGHARALLGLAGAERMIALATAIVADGLTVREVERRVRDTSTAVPVKRKARASTNGSRPAEVKGIEDQLRKKFQTDAAVELSGENRGTVRLAFYSTDDLERLLDLLLGAEREAL